MTRMLHDGYGGRRAGSFSGKTQADPIIVDDSHGGNVYAFPKPRRRREEDEAILITLM